MCISVPLRQDNTHLKAHVEDFLTLPFSFLTNFYRNSQTCLFRSPWFMCMFFYRQHIFSTQFCLTF